MTSKFKPPSHDQLASVDIAKCEYPSVLTEVVGVVSFDGQGGWPMCDDYKVHSLTLAAWRRIGQPVIQRDLLILRPVPVDGNPYDDFPKGSIHRLQLLISIDESRAVFANCTERNERDIELKSIAEELRKPVVIQTDRFGPLTLNRRIKQFEGKANWNGKLIDVSVEVDKNLDISRQLESADRLFADSIEWKKRVNDFAVTELLDLANDWQEESTSGNYAMIVVRGIARRLFRYRMITASRFLRRMQLDSISIKRDGEFEFWHSDGDLFFGHSIQVCGSLAEGLTSADIPG